MTSFFEHQRTSYKRNYLRNLIALAYSDGNLAPEEQQVIVRIGVRRGLKEWQVSELLEDCGKHEFFVPDSIVNRMNLLYDVMELVYADGIVGEEEIRFVTATVIDLKLDPVIVPELLAVFRKGMPGQEEWNEFLGHVLAVERRTPAGVTIL